MVANYTKQSRFFKKTVLDTVHPVFKRRAQSAQTLQSFQNTTRATQTNPEVQKEHERLQTDHAANVHDCQEIINTVTETIMQSLKENNKINEDTKELIRLLLDEVEQMKQEAQNNATACQDNMIVLQETIAIGIRRVEEVEKEAASCQERHRKAQSRADDDGTKRAIARAETAEKSLEKALNQLNTEKEAVLKMQEAVDALNQQLAAAKKKAEEIQNNSGDLERMQRDLNTCNELVKALKENKGAFVESDKLKEAQQELTDCKTEYTKVAKERNDFRDQLVKAHNALKDKKFDFDKNKLRRLRRQGGKLTAEEQELENVVDELEFPNVPKDKEQLTREAIEKIRKQYETKCLQEIENKRKQYYNECIQQIDKEKEAITLQCNKEKEALLTRIKVLEQTNNPNVADARVKEADARAKEADARAKEAEARVKEADERFTKANADLDTCQKKAQNDTKAIDECRQQVKQVQQERENLTNEVKKCKEDLNKQGNDTNKGLQKKLESLENSVKDKDKEIEKARKELAQAQATHSGAERDAEQKAKKAEEELKKAMAAAELRANEAERRMREAEETKKAAEAKNASEAELQKENKRLLNLLEVRAEKEETTCSVLTTQNAAATEARQKAEKRAADAENARIAAEKQAAAATARTTAAEKARIAAEKQVVDLQTQLQQQKLQAQVGGPLDELRSIINNTPLVPGVGNDAQIKNLNEAVNKCQEELRNAKTQLTSNAKMVNENNQLKQDIDKARQQYDLMKQELDRLTNINAEMFQTGLRVENERDDCKARYDLLVQQGIKEIQDLQTALDTCNNDKEILRRAVEDCNDKLVLETGRLNLANTDRANCKKEAQNLINFIRRVLQSLNINSDNPLDSIVQQHILSTLGGLQKKLVDNNAAAYGDYDNASPVELSDDSDDEIVPQRQNDQQSALNSSASPTSLVKDGGSTDSARDMEGVLETGSATSAQTAAGSSSRNSDESRLGSDRDMDVDQNDEQTGSDNKLLNPQPAPGATNGRPSRTAANNAKTFIKNLVNDKSVGGRTPKGFTRKSKSKKNG